MHNVLTYNRRKDTVRLHDRKFELQVLWTFSIYLESVAILPQLFLVSKTGEAESITSHYLFALGSYRGLYLLNWVSHFTKQQKGFDTISKLINKLKLNF